MTGQAPPIPPFAASAASAPATYVHAGTSLRADLALAAWLGCSRRIARTLCDDGLVVRNDQRLAKGALVHEGEAVRLLPAGWQRLHDEAEPATGDPHAASSLRVVAATAQWVAVCKPAGMPTLALQPGELGCAVNGLVALYPECARVGTLRDAGLCNRLDTGTSGLLLAARDDAMWHALRGAFREHRIEKRYLAAVHGRAAAQHIDVPLAQRGNHVVAGEPRDQGLGERERERSRWPALRRARSNVPSSNVALPAHTEVLAHLYDPVADISVVECISRYGRMHQIRAHLAYAGHPLCGDTLYGGAPASAAQGAGASFLLHAWRLDVPGIARLQAAWPATSLQQLAAWSPALFARVLADWKTDEFVPTPGPTRRD